MSAKKKAQPKKVQKIYCPNCSELQVKIYPYSSFRIAPGQKMSPCNKCQVKDFAR